MPLGPLNLRRWYFTLKLLYVACLGLDFSAFFCVFWKLVRHISFNECKGQRRLRSCTFLGDVHYDVIRFRKRLC